MAEKDAVTVMLAEPVTVGGETYDSLTLHPCRTKHLLAMDLVKGETRKAAALFASMAEVPLPVVEELAVDDFAALGEAAAPLMGNSGRGALDAARRQAAREISH